MQDFRDFFTIILSAMIMLSVSTVIAEASDDSKMDSPTHVIFGDPGNGASKVSYTISTDYLYEIFPNQGGGELYGSGGPDNYGYVWEDSDEQGTDLEFDWVEINQDGTGLALRDDQSSGPVNIGFNFEFYGNTYNRVNISSNGFVTFGNSWSGYDHRFRSFPDGEQPFNAIAPLWMDLDPNEETNIYYHTNQDQDKFIVEWDNVPVHENEWYAGNGGMPGRDVPGRDCVNEETFDFTAGQNIDVGDVRVYQEPGDNDIYVEITMTGGWRLEESQIDWGYDTDDIPHNGGGPIPGQFEYKDEFAGNGVTEHTVRMDNDDSDFTGVFVVHGSVRNGNQETAWAGSEDYPGGNWALYFEYEVIDCGDNENHAPVLTEIGDREIDEGELLVINLIANDEDDDNLTFSVDGLPQGAQFNGDEFSWQPSYEQNGVYEVTFTVTDDGDPNLSDEETVTITVADANRPPELEEIAPQTTDEGEELVFQLFASDPDDDNITLSARDLPEGAEFEGDTFTWTPDYTQSGFYVVLFTAQDDGNPNLFDPEPMFITVVEINDYPVLDAVGDKETAEGSQLAFEVTGSDPDDDDYTIAAIGLPQGAQFNNGQFDWTPGYDQAGEYEVTFRITDQGNPNLSVEETITITVTNANRAPVLAGIGDKSVDENEELTFDLSANDPDNDNISFSVNGLPQGAQFNNGTFTWTPGYGQAGVYQVTFTVTDDGNPNLSDEETIEITVGDINRPPVLAHIGNKNVDEGNELTFNLSSSDPDNDNLSYSVNGLPQGAQFNNGTFTWTPGYGQAGNYQLTFTVTDDGNPNLSDEETITISVGDVNRAPELAAIGDRETNENVQLSFQLSADDPDNDNLTFTADNLPQGAQFNGNTFTWTPGYNQAGDYQVTFTVTDDGNPNLDDEETITITVINVNRPPVLDEIGHQQVNEGSELTFDLSASDPDNDNLSYSVEDLPQGAQFNNGTFTWTPGNNQSGNYDVTFTVTDDGNPNLSDEEVVTISVGNVNRAPELAAIGDKEVDEADELTFQISADVPDNDNLTYTADDLPQGAQFNGTTFTWTPGYEQAGSYDVTFTVTDDGNPNLSDEETITITVNNTNRAPVLAQIGDKQVSEGNELTFDISANDADNDNLSYSVDGLPQGAQFNNGTFTWTPGNNQAGSYEVTFTVTDNGNPNLSDEETITITVTNINQAPVLAGIGDQQGEEGTELTFDLSANDPDNDNLSYSVDGLPQGAQFNNGTFTWTPGYTQAGSYDVTFTVTDDGNPNLSDEETITITISDTNRPPVLAGIGNKNVDEGNELTFDLSANDPDNDNISYEAINLPQGAQFNNGTFTWTPDYNQAASYQVTFRATDDGNPNLSDEETIIITVDDVNRAPNLVAIGDKNVDEGNELTFNLSASDPDDDSYNYSVNGLPQGAQFNNGVFTWTPGYNQAGSYDVTFTVTDDGNPNMSDEETITITVDDINRPPVLAGIGNKQVTEGFELTFDVTADDPDNDNISITADDLPQGATFNNGTFTWTPDFGDARNYHVTFTVTDDGNPNLSDEETIRITVIQGNRAPVLAGIGDQDMDEGQNIAIHLSANDPDNDNLTYSIDGLPQGATFNNGVFNWSPGYDQSGSYDITFTVTDDGNPNRSDSETITLTVNDINRPPVLDEIGNLQCRADEEFNFDLTATDPDNDNLTFTANGLPQGAQIVNGTFTWEPTVEQAGFHEITFIVTDDGNPNLSDEETIMICVCGGDQPTLGPKKFQLILHADGSIIFQYNDNNTPHDQGVIGIQNWNGTDGITVAANTDYTYDGLAVRLTANVGMVNGTIRNENTNDPIQGATVTLSNGSLTTTDANGYFEFLRVPIDHYTLEVEAANFVDITTDQFPVNRGQVTTINIGMAPSDFGGGGDYDTPGTANNIFVLGNLMFVADGENGLLVYDVTDPDNPVLVGSFDTDGEALSVYVIGNYAYVADGSNGLVVLNISDLDNITLVGHYDSPGVCYHVYVSGNYAYVADGQVGMLILNISNLQNIQFVSSYNTAGTAVYITVYGNYAFIADLDGGFYCVNIENVYNLQLEGTWNGQNAVYNFQIVGNYAYVVDGDGGLVILDISDPGNIQVVGTFDTPGTVVSLYISGGYLYLLDSQHGLYLLDISDPADPSFVAQYQIQGGLWVIVYGGYAYIATGNGFVTIDISQFTGHPIVCSLNSPQGGQVYQPGDTINFNWSINARYDIDYIRLYYSTNGGDRWTQIVELQGGIFNYQWIVPDIYANNFGLKIVVVDVQGNEVEVVVGGSTVSVGTYTAEFLFSAWNFISLPLIPTNPHIDAIFGDDVQHPGIYVAYGFDHDIGNTVPQELENGLGYWVVIAHDDNVEVDMEGTARVDTFRYSLDLEWNMIGCPYPVDIPISDIIWNWEGDTYTTDEAVEDYLLFPCFFGFDNERNYFESQTLEPWHGYWFLTMADSIEMVIPPPVQGPIIGAAGEEEDEEEIASYGTPEMWEATIRVSTDEARDQATLGTTTIARDGFDGKFDFPQPQIPRTEKWMRAYFTHNDWVPRVTTSFSRDIRSPMNGQTKEWNLTIQTNDPGATTLSWNSLLDKAPENFRYLLIDDATGRSVNMLATSEYQFQNNGQYRTFSIYVTAPLLDVHGNEIAPEEYELLSAYPNPFNASVNLKYMLKNTTNVKLAIYDMRGSLVEEIVNSSKPAGVHNIIWNADEEAAGVYLVRMQTSETTTMQKIMLVK